MSGFALGLAYILDLILGDPPSAPHPVRLMGKAIAWSADAAGRRLTSPVALRAAGAALVLFLVAASYGATWLLLAGAALIAPALGLGLGVVLAYTTLAGRSLYLETWRAAEALKEGDLEHSRRLLSLVVGRETSELDQPGVLRALIETVAENLSDGLIAPLFYLALGGPALGMAFKAVSTLDSMIGYKNEKYRDLGWAAARTDDLANFVPARITAGLIVAASFLLGLDWRNAFRFWLSDGGKHSSPNAGRPEAAMAGALGVRLGGPAVYGGQVVVKPHLGPSLRPLTLDRAYWSEQISIVSGGLMVLLLLAIRGPF